ncbi:MAG: nitroreductase family protein [Thermodesulfobacteriota bacterium]
MQSSVDILTLLKSRRSIRICQDKPVPQNLLLQILEAGRWAPTGANLQPWHFIVVTDAEKPLTLPLSLEGRGGKRKGVKTWISN